MESMFTTSDTTCFTKVLQASTGLFNVIIFDGYSSDAWNQLSEVEAFILLNRVSMGWGLKRLQGFTLN